LFFQTQKLRPGAIQRTIVDGRPKNVGCNEGSSRSGRIVGRT
jgi:hypothetical protein